MSLGIVILAFIIGRIPVISNPIRTIYILIHEVGHVVGAKMTFGWTEGISINSDVSGLAKCLVRGNISAFITSISGYIYASMVSLLLVILTGFELYHVVFYMLIIGVAHSLIFWVRNGYGFLWGVGFILVAVFFNLLGGVEFFVKFVVATIYIEAVIIACIPILESTSGQNAGDAEDLQEITGISSKFWGVFFVVMSVTVFVLGIKFW